MKTVVALGSLREDITFKYDFSRPLNVPEVKVNNAEWSVGGSVHNTCLYLSLKSSDVNVHMCSSNYILLVQRVNQYATVGNYRIITTTNELKKHPVSIIGVCEDGDKHILSYDPIVDKELLLIFEREVEKADFVYTSLYEINDENYRNLCEIFQKCHSRGVTTMIDLCPLVSSFNVNVLREVLKKIVIVSGNEYEFKELMHKLCVDDMNELLLNFSNVQHLFVKKGNRGAEYKTRRETKKYEFCCCEQDRANILNTTGCGDVFNAVIIEGFCLGDNSKSILQSAVIESGRIAKRGLPWIK